MDNAEKTAALSRRRLLQAGAGAALVAPFGGLAAQALSLRAAAEIDLSQFPICRTAAEGGPLTGAPRKLKLSWNAVAY